MGTPGVSNLGPVSNTLQQAIAGQPDGRSDITASVTVPQTTTVSFLKHPFTLPAGTKVNMCGTIQKSAERVSITQFQFTFDQPCLTQVQKVNQKLDQGPRASNFFYCAPGKEMLELDKKKRLKNYREVVAFPKSKDPAAYYEAHDNRVFGYASDTLLADYAPAERKPSAGMTCRALQAFNIGSMYFDFPQGKFRWTVVVGLSPSFATYSDFAEREAWPKMKASDRFPNKREIVQGLHANDIAPIVGVMAARLDGKPQPVIFQPGKTTISGIK